MIILIENVILLFRCVLFRKDVIYTLVITQTHGKKSKSVRYGDIGGLATGIVFQFIVEENTGSDSHEHQTCNVQELNFVGAKNSADISSLRE